MQAEDFLGCWQIVREIEDRRGPDGRFEGRAVISEVAPGEWLYHETGRLSFGDAQGFDAERRYLWRPSGAVIDVFFEDGRPFHRIALSGGADRHHCAPDIYDVRYEFGRWPDWETVWRVSGPRKDYAMRSRYRQQDLQSGAAQG